MSNNTSKEKTVIVFSTYYNSPIWEDRLFSLKTAKPMPMTGNLLCNFFWKSIISDKNNGEELIRKVWNLYLTEKGKIELEKEINDRKSRQLSKLIEFINKNPKVKERLNDKVEDMDFDNYLLYKAGKISKDFEYELELYQNAINNAPLEVLKEKDGAWVSMHLKNEGQQDAYEMKFPSNFNPSSSELKNKPLLSYRFSYYKLIEESETEVYAVWPLDTPANDENEWIEALSEQFGKNANHLYLILHAKDVNPDIVFKVIPLEKYDDADRFVALFQHSGAIGAFLRGEHSIDEICEFVENSVKNYYYIMEASKLLAKEDFDKLEEICSILPDKYKELKDTAERLKDDATKDAVKDEDIDKMESLINSLINKL